MLRRPAALIGAAACLALSACTPLLAPSRSVSAVGSHLITPSQAEKTVRSYWSALNSAYAGLNPAPVSAFAAGPAAGAYTAVITTTRFSGDVIDPTAIQALSVYVPHQSAYPGQFLALVRYAAVTSSPELKAVTFTSTGPGHPWLATLDVALDPNTSLPEISRDSDGYAFLVPGDFQAASLAVAAPAAAAAYIVGVQNGIPGDSFSSGVVALGVHSTGLVHRLHAVSAAALSNEKRSFTFPSSGSDLAAYRTGDGGAFTVFDFQHTQTFQAAANFAYTIGQGQDAFASAGRYQSLTSTFDDAAAMTIPSVLRKGLAQVVGLSSQVVSVTGVPA